MGLARPAPVVISADIGATFLRIGAIALIAAGLMSLPVLFAVHPPTDPAQNREWAIQANSASYRMGWMLRVYATVPLLLGAVATFVALSDGRAARTALAGMVVTVVAGCTLLAGMAFPVIVMPAAGVLIDRGEAEPILRLLEQVFLEPAWLPVFVAGLVYNAGWIVIGLAVRESSVFPRGTGSLLVLLGVVGIPAFLDVVVLSLVAAVILAAAAFMLSIGLWRRAASIAG